MIKRDLKESGIPTAVFATVLLYFLFKICLLFTLTLERDSPCLSRIWRGEYQTSFTPFVAFLIVAIASAVWFFSSCAKHRKRLGKGIYLLVGTGAIFFYFWFKGFYVFWFLMEYEKDHLTLAGFFAQSGGAELYESYGKNLNIEALCKSSNQD